MPPLTRLRIGTLDRLVEQLRFAPPATLRKQCLSAEEIAREIVPTRNYPVSWLVFRLTGFRTDGAEADEILVGDALMGELSALIERLSDRSGMTIADLGEDALTLESLCARWRVDRKTIERRRRQGLIGHRVIGEDGRRRLAFRLEAVERFEERLGGAASKPLTRISAEVEAKIVKRAERYRRSLGLTLNQAAERLAPKFGRSREAIRRVLRRFDEESGRPIFAEQGPLDERSRRLAFRALGRGIPPEALAPRLGVTRASVHRVVNERRAELLRRLDLSCASSPIFTREDAAEVILAPRAVREGLGAPGEPDLLVFTELARNQPSPDEATETARAAAFCFLRWRAAARIADLPRFGPRASDLDEIETALRWASLIQAELVRSQLRLALLSAEERLGRSMLSLEPGRARWLHGACASALASAVWGYDPFRGGRLASPSAVALTKTLGRLGESGSALRGEAATLEDWTRRVAPWQAWLEPRADVRAGLDRLDDLSQAVVRARHGWWRPARTIALGGESVADPSSGPPRTRESLAAALGMTAPTLARVERRALRQAAGLAPTPAVDERALRAARAARAQRR